MPSLQRPHHRRDHHDLASQFLDGTQGDGDGYDEEPLSDDDSLDREDRAYQQQQQQQDVSARQHAKEAAEDQSHFHEYLHSFGAQYEQHRTALRERRMAEEVEGLRPTPTITAFAQSKRRDEPIEERLFRLQEKRQAKQREERDAAAKAEEDRIKAESGGYLGKPKISAHAAALRRDGSIIESSQRWIENHKQRMQQLHEDAVKRELQELRPAPRIGSSSVTGSVDRGGLSVEDHLIMQEKQRQRRMYEQVEEEIKQSRKNAHPHLHHHHRHQKHASAQRSASATSRQSAMAAADGTQPGPHDPSHSTVAGHHTASVASSSSNVVDRLYNPHHKVPAYDAEAIEQCTFHPKVYSRPDPNDELMKLPVEDRLLKRREMHREAMARSVEERRRAAASEQGRPHLSNRSKQLAAERSSVTRLRSSSAADQQPAVNSNTHNASAAMNSSAARFGGSPTDRLYGDAQRRRDALRARSQAQRAASARGHTPKVSKKSNELVRSDPAMYRRTASGTRASASATATATTGSKRGFEERQLFFDRKANDAKERRRKEKELEEQEFMATECTFAPQLDRVREESRAKGKAKAERDDDPYMRRPTGVRVEGSFAERNDKWDAARKKRIEEARRAKQEREEADCVFNPEVIQEVPQITPSGAQPATGMDDHVQRMRHAQREKEIREQGGHQAVERRRRLEEEAARGGGDRRHTVAHEFHFNLPGNAGATTPRRSQGSAASQQRQRASAVGGDDHPASLRRPVTAADMDERRQLLLQHGAEDDGGQPRGDYPRAPAGRSSSSPPQHNTHPQQQQQGSADGYHHFYGGGSPDQHPYPQHQQQQQQSYHLPHHTSAHVGSSWASHGFAAPPETSGTGFLRNDAWGDPVPSAAAAGSSGHGGDRRSGSRQSDAAYEIGVAALNHQQQHQHQRGGGGYTDTASTGWSTGGSDAIVRQHHELYRQAVQAGAGRNSR